MGISDKRSQPHGQDPREARESHRFRLRRSRSHSRAKALEFGPGRSFRIQSCSRNLNRRSSEFILKLFTLKSNLPLCPLNFILTIWGLLPIFSSTNSKKGITLAYQIILIYIWQYFSYHAIHVRGRWSSYSILNGISQQKIIGGLVLGEAIQMLGFPKEIYNTVVKVFYVYRNNSNFILWISIKRYLCTEKCHN